jgi:cystathionine beta-lyase/cystathionine gamma-synthase
MQFETRAIHEGQEPDPATGAVSVPIYQTSTFAREEVERHTGYVYSRTGNPTRTALEGCLASLEGAAHGRAFASGLAATTCIALLLTSGDRVVSVNDIYGGTYRLFREVLEPLGVHFDFVTAEEMNAGLGDHLDERTKMVWVETPTNPLLRIVDIRAAADAAHAADALLVVDNTFASPYLQRPLELGADVVIHSTTKYIGGHSDVVGGFVATNSPTLAERLAFLQNATGAVPGPVDCWLVLRGAKTLSVRMREHCANAARIADWLDGHPAVERVHYPGLASHPQHDLAGAQMTGFGGVISFELAGARQDVLDVVRATTVWKLGVSLGGVESLIEYPKLMTHSATGASPFELPETLIRLSVGIEAADDLAADLEQAFSRGRTRSREASR